ncbi:MAG: hypothetical protein DRH06_05660, partial [Deltaproteobacteria bacterium]
TGPIVRGDIGTVTEHIKTLQDNAPELLNLYLQMGVVTVTNSQRSGRLNPESAAALQALFSAKIKECNAI